MKTDLKKYTIDIEQDSNEEIIMGINLKKFCDLCFAFVLCMLLIGCSMADKSITNREKTCSYLKSQLTFGKDMSNVDNISYGNPTQSAQAMRSYAKYNCTDFEK